MGDPSLLAGLDMLVREAVPEGGPTGVRRNQTVVFFDLVGSTARKLRDGHIAGVHATLHHNRVCREVAERFDGAIVKEMGDGVLAVFNDPLNATLAAENVRTGLALHSDVATKVGMTSGLVEAARIDGRPDVLGGRAARAARTQAAAAPGQILMDEAHAKTLADFLRDV